MAEIDLTKALEKALKDASRVLTTGLEDAKADIGLKDAEAEHLARLAEALVTKPLAEAQRSESFRDLARAMLDVGTRTLTLLDHVTADEAVRNERQAFVTALGNVVRGMSQDVLGVANSSVSVAGSGPSAPPVRTLQVNLVHKENKWSADKSVYVSNPTGKEGELHTMRLIASIPIGPSGPAGEITFKPPKGEVTVSGAEPKPVSFEVVIPEEHAAAGTYYSLVRVGRTDGTKQSPDQDSSLLVIAVLPPEKNEKK